MYQMLSRYFDEWFAEKEKYNLIKTVYGTTGLMAVVDFMEFVKYHENTLKYPAKEGLNGNTFNRKSCG